MTAHGMRVDSTAVIRGFRREGTAPPTVREVRDALAAAYPDCVFTGWTAAALHGAQFTEGHEPEIWLPQPRYRKGVIIRSGVLLPEDVVRVSRRSATIGALTAADIARRTEGDQAIAGFDQCIREDRYGRSVTTTAKVLAYLDAHPMFYNARRVREVLGESSTGADSPWETYTRLAAHRAGFRFFTTQCPVPGTPYHVDLGSARHRVALEYDGGYHRSVSQQRKDIARWNRITGQRWAIIRVTATTLRTDLAGFIARVDGELRLRGFDGPAPSTPILYLPASTDEPPVGPDSQRFLRS